MYIPFHSLKKFVRFSLVSTVILPGLVFLGCSNKSSEGSGSNIAIPYLGGNVNNNANLFPSALVQPSAATHTFLHMGGTCNGVTSAPMNSGCDTGKWFFSVAKNADKVLCRIGVMINQGVLTPDGNNYYFVVGSNEKILVSAQVVNNTLGIFNIKMCGGSPSANLNYGNIIGSYNTGTSSITIDFTYDADNFVGSNLKILQKMTVSGVFNNGWQGSKSIVIRRITDHSLNAGMSNPTYYFKMTQHSNRIDAAFAEKSSSDSSGRLSFEVLGSNYANFALGQGAGGGGLSGTLTSPQGWDINMNTGPNSTYEGYAAAISESFSTINYQSSQRAQYGIASANQAEGWNCQQGSSVDITSQVQSIMNLLMQCQ
ncbi:MAG: hypothetical protein RMK80_02630 [Pseudobdellovibrionaceae bacterium]|nr:hypothetical protein [Pseudobdellovibrionaceae bacterium]